MRKILAFAAIGAIFSAVTAATASASHSWNGYHWARTANPFTLKMGDNLTTSDWKSHLSITSSDWSKSTVLDTTIGPGQSRNKRCQATAGQDEICNGNYGYNGWLGVATIWLASGSLHITQGTVKVNDSYFSLSQYNYAAEKEHVMCQEVGHTLGLDHQDTSGISLDTCMDYYRNTSDTDTLSTSPNQHDYDELSAIYSHVDTSTTVGAAIANNLPDAVPSWSPASRMSESVYVDHLANGQTLVTYVLWASPFQVNF